MHFTWAAAKNTKTTDPYRDWFDHVYHPGEEGALAYDLVLVKLKPTGSPASFENTLTWLAAQVDGATATSDFLMDNLERDRLARLIGNLPTGQDAPDLARDHGRAGSELASTHGTHVADIAGGVDPSDTSNPLLTCPMLAVQLPHKRSKIRLDQNCNPTLYVRCVGS